MSKPLPILANARIASPCNMSWHAMKGDDRTRYCDQCEKNVFNLVGMSDDEATALIREKEGKLCARLYQRPDGTLLTSDCPVGLHAARRKLAKAVGAIAACVTMMLSAATFGALGRLDIRRLRHVQPFERIAGWFAPPTSTMILGSVSLAPDEIRMILETVGDESSTGNSVMQYESEALGPVFPLLPKSPMNVDELNSEDSDRVSPESVE